MESAIRRNEEPVDGLIGKIGVPILTRHPPVLSAKDAATLTCVFVVSPSSLAFILFACFGIRRRRTVEEPGARCRYSALFSFCSTNCESLMFELVQFVW